MTRLTIIVYTLLLLHSCTTTKSISTNKTITRENVRAYYKCIDQAELAITSNQYAQAVEFYLSARQQKPLFYHDIRNLLTCSVEAQNHVVAAEAAQKLLEKGVPYSYFEKKFFFRNFIKSKAWKNLKKANIQPDINLVLKAQLDSLEERDQEFRYDYDYYLDTIIAIDTMNREALLAIFDTYGYPGVNVVGFSMDNDTTISRSWNSLTVLLIHQVKNHPVQFAAILEDFLHKGQIRRGIFESHSKNFYPPDQYKLNCFGLLQKLFIQVKDEVYTCCCEAAVQIDALRAQYYMEPLEELKIKAVFHYERDSRFRFGGYAAKYDDPETEEEARKIKAELLEQEFILFKKLDTNQAYFRNPFRRE